MTNYVPTYVSYLRLNVRLDFLVRDWQNFVEEYDPSDSKEKQVSFSSRFGSYIIIYILSIKVFCFRVKQIMFF